MRTITALDEMQNHSLYRAVSYDAAKLIKDSGKLEVTADTQYIADDAQAGEIAVIAKIQREIFGEVPAQAGWCFGEAAIMNAMEWHKCSEVIVACTDVMLLLGDYRDIEGGVYDSSKAFGLYLKKGEVVELLPMTLHFAPMAVGEQFVAAIILPKGTNAALEGGAEGILQAVNKWLILHPDNTMGQTPCDEGYITGENIELNR